MNGMIDITKIVKMLYGCGEKVVLDSIIGYFYDNPEYAWQVMEERYPEFYTEILPSDLNITCYEDAEKTCEHENQIDVFSEVIHDFMLYRTWQYFIVEENYDALPNELVLYIDEFEHYVLVRGIVDTKE